MLFKGSFITSSAINYYLDECRHVYLDLVISLTGFRVFSILSSPQILCFLNRTLLAVQCFLPVYGWCL